MTIQISYYSQNRKDLITKEEFHKEMEYRIRKQYGDVKEYTYEYANSLKNAIYAEERRVKKGGVPSPTLDSVFKWMFGREETKIFACLLPSIVIEVEAEELEREMVLIQSEIPPEFFKGRTVRMDFVGKVGETIFNIEMNRTDTLERNQIETATTMLKKDSNRRSFKSVLNCH